MTIYIAKRLGLALVTLLLAVTLLYGMIHMVPGDPASIILGPRATPELREALTVRMGLDLPLYQQLLRFYAGVLRGDLGDDVFTDRPVLRIVGEQLPYTLMLIVAAMGWSTLLGVPLGCYSAVRRNTLGDRLTGVLSVACIAIPSFAVALFALLVFAVRLRWLPAVGAGAPGDWIAQLRHLILPAGALGLIWVGYIARLVRASMLEVLGENHVRTARAFGLPERQIVFRYALRIAILPTVTILGMGIGNLLSGALFTEIIFARPGIGKLIFDSVTTRNYPVVMGAVLVTTLFFVLTTTFADIVNAVLDPRARSGSRE